MFVRSEETWNQRAKLIQPGQSVGVSDAGDTVVVGPHVFVRNGETWSRESKLVDDDTDNYFELVGVSDAGDTVVVGAPGADDYAGAAYVFER
ncbi:FG-GAP repeat protein [Candidatus Halobonum tyrrellensis]|uniref:FG-GAP repeat protein n=1 Tax=Candidatus Halobonum tyrrellensis TaxID=1431545 RepID=UPI0006782501|nr:FG-GAP repeat protein [Candidatus Halobonum tyrrellensis]